MPNTKYKELTIFTYIENPGVPRRSRNLSSAQETGCVYIN